MRYKLIEFDNRIEAQSFSNRNGLVVKQSDQNCNGFIEHIIDNIEKEVVFEIQFINSSGQNIILGRIGQFKNEVWKREKNEKLAESAQSLIYTINKMQGQILNG